MGSGQRHEPAELRRGFPGRRRIVRQVLMSWSTVHDSVVAGRAQGRRRIREPLARFRVWVLPEPQIKMIRFSRSLFPGRVKRSGRRSGIQQRMCRAAALIFHRFRHKDASRHLALGPGSLSASLQSSGKGQRLERTCSSPRHGRVQPSWTVVMEVRIMPARQARARSVAAVGPGKQAVSPHRPGGQCRVGRSPIRSVLWRSCNSASRSTRDWRSAL